MIQKLEVQLFCRDWPREKDGSFSLRRTNSEDNYTWLLKIFSSQLSKQNLDVGVYVSTYH